MAFGGTLLSESADSYCSGFSEPLYSWHTIVSK
jgi:hypothetical protein